jgi:hypothetical protein
MPRDSKARCTTQAPFSFMTDLGHMEMLRSGVEVRMDLQELQDDLRRVKRDDREAMEEAACIVWEWIRTDPGRCATKVLHRLGNSWCGHSITLTTIPRDRIIGGVVEVVLLDRCALLLALGGLGLAMLGMKMRRGWIVIACVMVPWCASAVFVGEPRMLEPFVPLLISGVIWLVVVGGPVLGRWCALMRQGCLVG